MRVHAPTVAIELDDDCIVIDGVLHMPPEKAQEMSRQIAAVLPAAPLAFRPLPIVDMPTAPPAFTVAADAAVPPIQGADGSGS